MDGKERVDGVSVTTTDFLLELLSEEIPARMQAKAEADLARLFTEELGKAGLKAASIETYSTPRRLALIARALPIETESVSEELKGPRVGAPPQALEGFLRKTGLAHDQLVERGGILFAVVNRPGRAARDVLAEAIPAVVRAFPWPKSMRWGDASASTESPRWVRPLQGIVGLLGEDVVNFEIAGVTSGAATVGHRFHHPGMITIGGAYDYVEKLRACHVIVDARERQARVRDGAEQAASAAGLAVVADEGLVVENAGLTEWPVPLLGAFDPAFLDVPREVIQLTMRTNQKYFSLNDAGGELAPNFICTANVEAADGGEAIVAGNRKVLAARLSDARFFWETDLKTPLEDQGRKLGQIVFHEKLGTVAARVERTAKLARWMVERGIVKAVCGTSQQEMADQAAKAARLAKADLVTGMVGEFPELQGTIGGYIARAQGQPVAIADAVRDHYKPVGQGDDVPTDCLTVAVSLADKLDTLVAFFSIGEKPTGSRDPFALRRQALGVIQLLIRNHIRLPLRDVLVEAAVIMKLSQLGAIENASFPRLTGSGDHEITAEVGTFTYRRSGNVVVRWEAAKTPNLERGRFIDEARAVEREVFAFFAERLKVQQREAGVRHDLIDAVFALGGEDDLIRLLDRVRALQSFVETEEGANLLAGYKRAANILKKEGWDTKRHQVWFGYTPEPQEQALDAALDAAEPKVAAALKGEDFEGAMALLASLRAPVDAFFDKVTVNDADSEKRETRLALLARVRNAVHRVADFSRIEG